MTEKLLAEFPPVSTAEWEAVIAQDLKGASLEEKLIWHTPEGLAVRPFYRAEDTQPLPWTRSAPGESPYARVSGAWRIREQIESRDVVEANSAALAALAAGAEAIAFGPLPLESSADLRRLLLHLDGTPIHFACAEPSLLHLISATLRVEPGMAVVSTGYNPLCDLDGAARQLASAPAEFVPFTLTANPQRDRPANAVEETASALAAGIRYLDAMTDRGVRVDRAAAALEFSFALSPNYFFEMARLRAFRMLWARVVESFGGGPAAARARIAAHTVRQPERPDAQHLNILRGTTAAMAAVLGGADFISITPLDAASEAARRLARNTQVLLKHEAMLAEIDDAGGGSYLLESLTDQLAASAWKRMQEIEAARAREQPAGS